MNPGLYPYICTFHDHLGMKGEVIVVPQRRRQEPLYATSPQL